jgi:dTMP kinase
MFITFEGGEGAGKSTQVEMLASRLRSLRLAREVITTREPGGTPFAEHVRGVIFGHEDISPWTEVLLFAAARRDHLENVIEPALARDAWVICDRFLDSTIVYQGYEVDQSDIERLHRAWGMDRFPDMVFLLDIDPEVGLKRREAAGDRNKFDRKPLAFHQEIRERFLNIPFMTIVIDGNQDPETIAKDVFRRVCFQAGMIIP